MNENLLMAIAKLISEGVLFLILTIILFNEFTQVLKTLNVFTEKSIGLTVLVSLFLAVDNLLSNKFLGISIFK